MYDLVRRRSTSKDSSGRNAASGRSATRHHDAVPSTPTNLDPAIADPATHPVFPPLSGAQPCARRPSRDAHRQPFRMYPLIGAQGPLWETLPERQMPTLGPSGPIAKIPSSRAHPQIARTKTPLDVGRRGVSRWSWGAKRRQIRPLFVKWKLPAPIGRRRNGSVVRRHWRATALRGVRNKRRGLLRTGGRKQHSTQL